MVDVIVFAVAALIVIAGAIGVVVNPNPVRAALSLVASFFGVAVLFVIQEAHFLALVQVVVYAGAIVVLFLFVIMLLGVDKTEDIAAEPLVNQRPAAFIAGALMLLMILGGLFLSGPGGDRGAVAITGQASMTRALDAPNLTAELANADRPSTDLQPNSALESAEPDSNVVALARDLFTRNLFAFEATALLLTIATVGAVVLVRNQGAQDLVVDEPGTAER